MSVISGLAVRDGVLELTTTEGDRVRSVEELARYLSSHRTLTAADYRFLGAAAIAMTAAEHGSPLDRLGLLKFEDVHYMPLPPNAAGAAFSEGENEASSSLANVDPRGPAFEAYVRQLNRAMQEDA